VSSVYPRLVSPNSKVRRAKARILSGCDSHPATGRSSWSTTAIGVQYLSIRYTERLAEAGIEPSVGSVGDSYDNAPAETIIGLYKTEVIWRNGPWRNLGEVEFATLEWVDWFNHRRLFGPIGNIPRLSSRRCTMQTTRHRP